MTAKADVQSANTVGFNTITVEAGKWYMIGTQFKGIGEASGEIAINDLVKLSNVPASTFSKRTTDAPQIQFWNGTTYAYYYYISDASSQTEPVWATGKTKATAKFPLGKGFWFKAPPSVDTGATMTFAGEVMLDATSIDIDIGTTEWVMISNPFPTELTWDMITTSGVQPSTFSKRTTEAPQMQVWTGDTYKYYYYISDASGQSEPVWASGKTKASGVAAAIGGAFWVKSSTAGKLTISLNK